MTSPVQLTLLAVSVLNLINQLEAIPNTAPRIIKPFQDDMLAASRFEGDLLSSDKYGVVYKYSRPKAVEEMATSFSVHRKGKSVEGIEYRVVQQPPPPQTNSTTMNQLNYYHFDIDRLASSGFDVTQKTVVMIAGFRSELVEGWIETAKDGWLELYGDNVNVITVCWHDSSNGFYLKAVSNTVFIAKQLTTFLYYLFELSAASIDNQQVLDNVHLIGHSLGAHIAGFVGKNLWGRVGRITALDPAGPLFDHDDRSTRLHRSDARLVEVLHTNSGDLEPVQFLQKIPSLAFDNLWQSLINITGKSCTGNHHRTVPAVISGLPTSSRRENKIWFGNRRQIGHIDYYANDGCQQPGCFDRTAVCDHRRAHDIYVDVLRRELALRTASGLDQEQYLLEKRHRLVAFKANNYESFEAGENFAAKCRNFLAASLVNGNKILGQAEATIALQTQHGCVVPLFDFTSPLDKLIQELRFKHRINFEHDYDNDWKQDESRARYYFKTSAGKLLDGSKNYLVGDQYLLRIYLANENGENNDGFRWAWPRMGVDYWCSLRVNMIMSDGKTANMELGHVKPVELTETTSNGFKQLLLAIPFVHPAGSEARNQLEHLYTILNGEHEQIDRANQTNNCGQSTIGSLEFSSLVRRLMPDKIMLTVHENKPSLSGRPICRLNIVAVEIQPVTIEPHRQTVGALYADRLALGGQIPLKTSEHLVDHLPWSPKSRLSLAARLATGEKGAIKSFNVGLESAVIYRWMI